MKADKKNIEIALVIYRDLFLKGFSVLIQGLGYDLSLACKEGRELLEKLDSDHLPNIIFIDIDFEQTSAYETILWLSKNYPSIKILALCMDVDRPAIDTALQNGASGFMLKTADSGEVKSAIKTVLKKGQYFSTINPFRLYW